MLPSKATINRKPNKDTKPVTQITHTTRRANHQPSHQGAKHIRQRQYTKLRPRRQARTTSNQSRGHTLHRPINLNITTGTHTRSSQELQLSTSTIPIQDRVLQERKHTDTLHQTLTNQYSSTTDQSHHNTHQAQFTKQTTDNTSTKRSQQ